VDQGQPSTAGEGLLSKPESSSWLIWEGDAPVSSLPEFSDLCRLINASGLLQTKPVFRWARAGIMLTSVALVTAAMILWRDNLAAQILNATLLGFVFMQIGFLMHEVGHRQIFRSPAANRAVGLLLANLMIGVSYSWWVDKHNRHHRNPNHVDLDPDLEFAAVAFSKEQAMAKTWPWRSIVKYQALLFLPFLLGEHVNLHVRAFEHVLRGRAKQGWAEGILLVCHHLACFGIAFSVLGTLPAIAFLACSKAIAGLYAGLVFAPNHKGMLMVDSSSQANWFRQQVLTSRNVRSNPINDFLYGGLNYQIEHHLFPFLRQDQLAAAQTIVRPFCLDRRIRYHETSIFQSLKEVFHHLQEVGAPVRADDPAKIPN
jgi:fatty acid desaturase